MDQEQNLPTETETDAEDTEGHSRRHVRIEEAEAEDTEGHGLRSHGKVEEADTEGHVVPTRR